MGYGGKEHSAWYHYGVAVKEIIIRASELSIYNSSYILWTWLHHDKGIYCTTISLLETTSLYSTVIYRYVILLYLKTGTVASCLVERKLEEPAFSAPGGGPATHSSLRNSSTRTKIFKKKTFVYQVKYGFCR